ncbi:DUF7281 domain-containing protein [Thiocystis violascens]|uniref:DUF7281 domain-containing protein n=1 Tax=Thiocystis violascens (strain ATCC 17096 / DSM 198 / 6111) TaxID=765911 RepID=I3YCL4_THIV6|nr:hypothetical protein [Thiocystis violascens]AFL74732.1 hypothetical protein Thivi_2816 [Thiocystis violascens DSM 198]
MAELTRRHLLAVHRLLRERLDKVPNSAVWERIRLTFEIGEARGRDLHFSDEERQLLREQCRLAWGFDPLDGVPQGNRREVAVSAIDEKIAAERPDDRHVLVKGRLPEPLPPLASDLSLRLPISSLNPDAIGQVVVIENLDSFDDWHAFRSPDELADALVLYRGHGGLARGARNLLSVLPEHSPVTVFPDWDPAGLQIAQTLPRADGLLVPELNERLLAKGSPEHFARQHRQIRFLDSVELDRWQSVWAAMKAARISLKQQHMLALDATLERIPRR